MNPANDFHLNSPTSTIFTFLSLYRLTQQPGPRSQTGARWDLGYESCINGTLPSHGWGEPPVGVTEGVIACPHNGLVSFEHNVILLPPDAEAELLATSKLPALP